MVHAVSHSVVEFPFANHARTPFACDDDDFVFDSGLTVHYGRISDNGIQSRANASQVSNNGGDFGTDNNVA